MKQKLDNKAIWNEAAVSGLLFGAVSIGCLAGKELASSSGNAFLMTAAGIVLWAAELIGCIYLMRDRMLKLRDKYEGVMMTDTYRFGRRVALLSGLLLASAQALFIMQMPEGAMDTALAQAAQSLNMTSAEVEQAGSMLDRLPLMTFLFQWLYCFLYGSVLSAIMSRYIFIRRLFDQPEDPNKPDEQ